MREQQPVGRGMKTYQWVVTILGAALCLAVVVIGTVAGEFDGWDLARFALIGLVIAAANWAVFGRRR